MSKKGLKVDVSFVLGGMASVADLSLALTARAIRNKMSTPAPKKIPLELRMLSGSLPSLSDRDRRTRKARKNDLTLEQNNEDAIPHATIVQPTPCADEERDTRYKLQSRILDQEGGGDIAANINTEAGEEADPSVPPITPNKRPESNGKHSFRGIELVNVWLPLHVVIATF